jgi:DNA-directed RNA polymerase specialized sigma subunit
VVQQAPTKLPAVVKQQSRTNMAAPKAEIQQEAGRPPWESRFAQYRGMTKADYEELEPENIVDFFIWWVKDNQS